MFTPFGIDPGQGSFCSLDIDLNIRKVLKLESEQPPPNNSLDQGKKKNHKIPKRFSDRKVSVNQAIGSLGRNGIRVNEDQAAAILDFLYLSAGSFSTKKKENDISDIKTEEISNR